ncbi:hypothetical protein [Microvirga sp. Mcv34]|uniref:hypothetical protein n=1 Tax=Microvirga sp. Mcv34 TaxID=2926016 RepID=UPI0021C918FE|nr:hypothetical protein [Microvirga sp. Mcv34]
MTERVRCCVPFCRRTIAAEKLKPWNEWICGKHWSAVPKIERREYSWTKRRIPNSDATSVQWERLKAVAIEAAAGI